MTLGERFILGSHSSLMIKTDCKMQSVQGTIFLVVSENGLIEWLKDDQVEYLCVKSKESFLSLSNSIKNKIIKNISFT